MILVGYTHKPGRVDHESIENFKKDHHPEKVVIFCREEPSNAVKELFKEYEMRLSRNPSRDAKRYGKELKREGKEVIVVDLQDFGERAIRDVC